MMTEYAKLEQQAADNERKAVAYIRAAEGAEATGLPGADRIARRHYANAERCQALARDLYAQALAAFSRSTGLAAA
ncbi:MAG: hypothetical protein AAF608_05120 [Pseudomonadota bacterium]